MPPIVLQVAGLVMLLAAFVFWMFTRQESSLLVGAALTLCTAGLIAQKAGRLPSDPDGDEDSAP